MVNCRLNKKGYRQIYISEDEGKTWTTHPDYNLVDPGCNAGIIRWDTNDSAIPKGILLFVNAFDPHNRKNLTLSISKDDGKTWSAQKTIYQGPAAYATVTLLENADLGIVFEKDNYTQNSFVRISKAQIHDLLD